MSDLVKARFEELIGTVLGVRANVTVGDTQPQWLRIRFRESVSHRKDLIEQCVGLVRTQLAIWAMYPSTNPLQGELFIRIDDTGVSNLVWWKEHD